MKWSTPKAEALFNLLDVRRDGRLSRRELHTAAANLKWHWPQAPLFALLDLLCTPGPLTRDAFFTCLQQMAADPLGPYGRALLQAAPFPAPQRPPSVRQPAESSLHPPPVPGTDVPADGGLLDLLERLPSIRVAIQEAAVLIVDPQASFTRGAWMRSIGPGAGMDVRPIRQAFDNCSLWLKRWYGRLEVMFTRCPFPPDSYGWDRRLVDVLDRRQMYFIKPGNSVLFPPSNGFDRWIESCLGRQRKILVLGGCTLNSCVRVSAEEVQHRFAAQGLQVVVDLSLCGARAANYMASPEYDGISAVALAVRRMRAAGVRVVRRVHWEAPPGGG